MLNLRQLTPAGLETGAPLDAFARALSELAKKQPKATMQDLPTPVVLYWPHGMGPGGVVVEKDDGLEERRVEAATRKGEFVWLPAYSVVRLVPDTGTAWSLGITRNGTVRQARGADATVSREPEPTPEGARDGTAEALRWLAEGEVGASSMALCNRLMAVGLDEDGQAEIAHPHDADDLRRCVAFLDAVPAARERLAEMAEVSPNWAALMAEWPTLEAILRQEMAGESKPSVSKRMAELLAHNNLQPRRPGI